MKQMCYKPLQLINTASKADDVLFTNTIYYGACWVII